MATGTFLWTTLGAFLTLCIFSFLYRDNPLYKFAEHLMVGVSAGYFVILLWHNGLVPNLFSFLSDGHFYFLWLDAKSWWYIVPALLGVMMWTRFSRKWAWISRWPIAIYIGIGTGITIPLVMRTSINLQLYASIRKAIDWGNFFGHGYLDSASGFSQLLIFVGVVSALFYFFFSKEHTGLFNGIAKFGIGILMIGFGASFGYTVMGRISLFVQRIQALGNWTTLSWHSNTTFLIVWLLIIGIFALLSIYEFIRFLGRRGATE
ncbi:conserved membrane hypothetical protein [Candidatus Zixiibacteriota bacterium]|nr:conserved membrane hypothetical protein [candidate division Zixibacteria bacterium]